jgi:hypothetical protein
MDADYANLHPYIGTIRGYATIIMTKKVVIVLNLISCENNKNKTLLRQGFEGLVLLPLIKQ